LKIHPVEFSKGHIGLLHGKAKKIFLSNIDNLSSVLSNNKAAKKAFYDLSPQLLHKVSSNMGAMKQKQGIGTILKRLHRIRFQDILLVLHAKVREKQTDE